MVMCFAPTCCHYSEKQDCKFFKFPQDPTKLKKWVKLIRRADRVPSIHSRICSCHFIDGDKANGPAVYSHNVGKHLPQYSKPKRRKYMAFDKEARDGTASNNDAIAGSPSRYNLAIAELSTSNEEARASPSNNDAVTAAASSSSNDETVIYMKDEIIVFPEVVIDAEEASGTSEQESESHNHPTFSAMVEEENCFLKQEVEKEDEMIVFSEVVVGAVEASGTIEPQFESRKPTFSAMLEAENYFLKQEVEKLKNVYDHNVRKQVPRSSKPKRQKYVDEEATDGTANDDDAIAELSSSNGEARASSSNEEAMTAAASYDMILFPEVVVETSARSEQKSERHSPTFPALLKVEETFPATLEAEKTFPATLEAQKNFPTTLEAENYFLNQEIERLKNEVKKFPGSLSYRQFEGNDYLTKEYTGLPTYNIFEALISLYNNVSITYFKGWQVVKLEKADQILLTLMKLKLNLLNEDLAVKFNISKQTVANIFITWVFALHEILFKQFMKDIPSRRKKNCRVIIDCTKVKTIKPKKIDTQKISCSYTHSNTLKGLIGCAPNGLITFASKLYPGSISDKKLTDHSGILKEMISGDVILADRGFLITDILPEGVSLNPPFLSTPQFTPSQIIERAVRGIKMYTILHLVPAPLIKHSSTIFQVIAGLTNLNFLLIKEELFL